MARENTVRVTITLTEDLKDWFQSQAEMYAVPMSGMMAIAMAQYRQQQEGMKAMQDMSSLYEKLQEIEIKLDNSKK
jgi:uncharacterized pyridoxal phosphate-containing UPF0001 family protein